MSSVFNRGPGAVKFRIEKNGQIFFPDISNVSYFYLQEFVPESIYKKYGINSIWFLDQDLIPATFALRELIGVSMIVNNWNVGGKFNNRGFRPPDSLIGGKLSQHRFGRAIDFHTTKNFEWTRNFIWDNMDLVRQKTGFTTIEDYSYTDTWIHLDLRNSDFDEGLFIVKPSK